MNKSGFFKWTVLVLVLLVTVCVVGITEGRCAAKGEKVFKFAHLAPFSGTAGTWGKWAQASFEIAAENINKDGGIKVKGEYYKVVVIPYDHQYNPTVTATLFKKVIYDDGIKFMNICGAGVVPGINDLAQKEKVIVTVTGAGSTFIGPRYPYTWKLFHDATANEAAILTYATKKYPKYTRIAAFYPDDDMGQELSKNFPNLAKQYNLTVTDVIFSDRGTTDFYPALTRVLAKNIDYIEMSVTPNGQKDVIIKAARELGFKGVFLDSDCTSVINKTIVKESEGLLGSSVWITIPTSIGKDWAKRFEVKINDELKAWTAYNYDGLMLLRAAIEKADSLDTSKIIIAMEQVKAQGIFGETKFGGKSLYGANRALTLWSSVAEVQNGKFVEVFKQPSPF